jgi:bifunctional DNA-binding transcriptional regulator/antitoxin component of YhaV-PrlF toxin-antitoxin module
MKVYKVLGKRGRITIPLEIRRALGFAYNDVVSFEQDTTQGTGGDAVLVKREKLCDGCKATNTEQRGVEATLHELLDDLTAEEMRTALIRLSVRWAEMTKGGDEDA